MDLVDKVKNNKLYVDLHKTDIGFRENLNNFYFSTPSFALIIENKWSDGIRIYIERNGSNRESQK